MGQILCGPTDVRVKFKVDVLRVACDLCWQDLGNGRDAYTSGMALKELLEM